MGRGRAKAKQTKVARALKYSSPDTNFSALEQELHTSGDIPQRGRLADQQDEQDDDDRCYLRVSTAVAPITGIDAHRALAFNWQSRVGYLAIGELDGVPYLQLCENRPYSGLDAAELSRLVLEIGGMGDRLERMLTADGDLL